MDTISTANLKLEILRALNGSNDPQRTIQVAGSTMVFSACRLLRTADNEITDPKPYPETAAVLPDEYDSWLS